MGKTIFVAVLVLAVVGVGVWWKLRMPTPPAPPSATTDVISDADLGLGGFSVPTFPDDAPDTVAFLDQAERSLDLISLTAAFQLLDAEVQAIVPAPR